MSNNAPGIPHAYLRSRAPLRTPVGDVEWRWIIGGLTESLYFDRDTSYDVGAISAAVATLRLAADTGLTLGVARSVYSGVSSAGGVMKHAFDVLGRWDQHGDTMGFVGAHPSDQLLSLFGRWIFPRNGVELYAEWAKVLPPRSLRELLVEPQRTQGFTVGMQWVKPMQRTAALRLLTEVTMLEQTPPSKGAAIPSFYVSRGVPQGYTQRGQVIGAAIGPGSAKQWIAADYLRADNRIGLVVG